MDPQVASFLAALDETQYLAPGRLVAYQRRALEPLLRHARAETAFYADRLAPMFRSDDTIDWERWLDLPVVTRADAQENFDALSARHLPAVAGAVSWDITSGSTGRPLHHLTCGLQTIGNVCCSERFYGWHGTRPEAVMARIRATQQPDAHRPEGRRHKGWRPGHPESDLAELSIATPPEQQLAWLRDLRPAYLSSYPSNLREIARLGRAQGETLPIAQVFTSGETLSADRRAAIRDFFGVEPLDRYGTSEIGYIAGACPVSRQQHVSAELVLLEIVGPDDKPVPPGTAGRIVVTSFYNLAMPLIRYDTGDCGILASDPCPCGRTLPLLERIFGRTRNILHFGDGTSIWPELFFDEVAVFMPLQQYQVVQTALDTIEFRFVPERSDQANDFDGLTAYVRQRLHPSLTVKPIPVSQIPRAPGGKFEDYVSLVVPAGDRPAGA